VPAAAQTPNADSEIWVKENAIFYRTGTRIPFLEGPVFKIERKDYGVRLTFSGMILTDEMALWLVESQKAVLTLPERFGVFVDMRTLRPLVEASQRTMHAGQRLYKENGLERSVVILDNDVVTMQFKRIAKETGIDKWERYIDASQTPDWEAKGLEWVIHGVDPNLP
jgi:hypothetical protein